jgi:putative glycosyltransferase
MKLSIVTSMYKSEEYVREFYSAICDVVRTITDDFEIIYVDDGSPDKSSAIVAELHASDPRVRLIKLSRNCGQSIAMLAGMRKALGDCVYTSDIDLEDPPTLLAEFDAMIAADPELQSVYGYMNQRQGRFLERWFGRAFYMCLGFLSRERIPAQVWARLMTRKFLDALLSYTEYHLFWSGLFYSVGFKQIGVPVVRRKSRRTSYSYAKKIDLALSAVTSFSVGPLHLIFMSGLLVSMLSLVGAVLLLWRYLGGEVVPGWTSIVISVLFTGGVTNLSIGLIGIYIGRIFIQSKNRPQFFIEKEL